MKQSMDKKPGFKAESKPCRPQDNHADKHNPESKGYTGRAYQNPCPSHIENQMADRRANTRNPNNPNYEPWRKGK